MTANREDNGKSYGLFFTAEDAEDAEDAGDSNRTATELELNFANNKSNILFCCGVYHYIPKVSPLKGDK